MPAVFAKFPESHGRRSMRRETIAAGTTSSTAMRSGSLPLICRQAHAARSLGAWRDVAKRGSNEFAFRETGRMPLLPALSPHGRLFVEDTASADAVDAA